ncbi:hypothetical protein ACH4FX_42735 [Streptomyces sp. NPDC018019]|uniref:hypothetical protein n=1 Tax=Streptomyces sp. NPDC018019 TaxID=3365030 RepID=UPI0037974110
MARLDHADGRTEYQATLQTSGDRGSASEPTDRELIPKTAVGCPGGGRWYREGAGIRRRR